MSSTPNWTKFSQHFIYSDSAKWVWVILVIKHRGSCIRLTTWSRHMLDRTSRSRMKKSGMCCVVFDPLRIVLWVRAKKQKFEFWFRIAAKSSLFTTSNTNAKFHEFKKKLFQGPIRIFIFSLNHKVGYYTKLYINMTFGNLV